jgi:CRP-like cAMP-binding protein
MKTLETKIAEHAFSKGMSAEHLHLLAECARELEFQPGQIIFRENAIAYQFYLILEGQVQLEDGLPKGKTLVAQTIGAGDVLGWSWLFPPFLWHFQARSLEHTQAILFDAAHLLIACERQHEFGFELMKRIAQVLIQRLQATRKQLLERRGVDDGSMPIPSLQRNEA